MTFYEAQERAQATWRRVVELRKCPPETWRNVWPSGAPTIDWYVWDGRTSHYLDTNGHAWCHQACADRT